ncbi:2-oxo-4-hydroxy-4-carboxy-5-ureidoimidazoline decarboxylase [Streptomyces sp. NPDC005423]|uniref:2-oxo-4-hydroxy-4-carboxy-5-ureidoimidazoline decarboxylase n=1 Tax=Streptomyces sp. NPDC005423 TaxID=3155343 RepID=UPI0033B397C8
MHRHPRLPCRAAVPALPEQPRAPRSAHPLDGFNSASPDDVHHTLLSCLHSLRWARRLADHHPYPDLEALLAAADEAAYDLTAGDLAEALAGESLPALPDDVYSAAHLALGAAHAAYESRFGHTFVSCEDGVPPDEVLGQVLAGIRSRLTNDPEDELVVAAEELRRLARARLTRLLR